MAFRPPDNACRDRLLLECANTSVSAQVRTPDGLAGASFCQRSRRRGIVALRQISARLREGVSGVLVLYARFAFEKAA
jgi:hypothetical protein